MKRTTVGLFIILTALTLAVGAAPPVGRALAEDTQRVGLVIRFDNGRVFTDCIDYTGSGMTGEDVLDASGLPIVKDFSYGLGAAICKIKGNGCDYPKEHCFCECAGATCEYWAYYHLDQEENEWVYSGKGVSGHTVQPGDVEGWAWGDGEFGGSEVAPPLMSFEELCPAPTPSAPVVEFTADPEHILAGQCSTLSWTVENAEIVVLDGEGVQPDDARYLCPSETQTYELEVLNGAGEYSYEVTIEVTQPTATPRPTATPTATRSPTPGTTSAPPPSATSTPAPVEPTSSPSGPPTPSPTSVDTPVPTVVAMAPTATPTTASGEEIEVAEPGEVSESATASSDPALEETVGLGRILLLLGVGAGTLGFGTLAFVAITLLLVVIYIRARAQF